MKETNSDEEEEKCAVVQVPKPLEPFDNENDSDDSDDDLD